MLPWWSWSIVANLFIIATEYMNRTGDYNNAFSAFLHTGPLIVVAQIGLFYAWSGAPSLMAAWAFFTVGNSLVRLVVVQYGVGEALNMWTLGGVALMMCGAFAIKEGI